MTMPANEVAELQERMREGEAELARIEADRAASANDLDTLKAKIAEYDEQAARIRQMLGEGAAALGAHYKGFQQRAKSPRKYARRAASEVDAVTRSNDGRSARRNQPSVPVQREDGDAA